MAIPGYDANRPIYPGLDRTNAGLGGNIPQQTFKGTYAHFERRLYKSPREVALLLDKTFRAAYGSLPLGTILAKDTNSGNLIPYTPDTISESDYSRVFLSADLNAAATCKVPMMESYKVDAGDVVVFTDTDGTYEEATIDAVDRESETNLAEITLTGAVSGSFSVAKMANCYLKAEDASSGKRSVAVYVLDMTVDTGAGEDAKGGLGPVLLTNAILYQDAVDGIDATAMAALGITEDYPYYVIR